SSDFSVAVATIGIFGYELLGHELIDLVGLTDSTIARHSEDPIPGMVTTWKEQKHNSRYLLERGPDYIVFSTGIKPSAPAERALLLYRQFMDAYRTLGWYYPGSASGGRGIITIVFKRTHPVEGEIVPVYPVEYVTKYKQGLEAVSAGDFGGSVPLYEAAMRISPDPNYIYVDMQRAFSLMMLNRIPQAKAAMDSILVRDSSVFEAHTGLYRMESVVGSRAKAEIHKRWLLKLVPWYWPRVETTTNNMIREYRNRR
ncbi:MAG: tetratricopeptide repeat protein, partial [bacterium]|nr:tetratricopeptide repeat protein [bacterium]